MEILTLKDIKKSYTLGKEMIPVLKGIDLTVEKGEYIAIIGSSGSGKSTLMNILGCLDTITSGIYQINHVNVESLNDNQLSDIRNREIGFIYQTFNLLMKKNIFDNISLPIWYSKNKKINKQSIITLIERVGLGDRIDHKPNELSGGQRQRVAIARALVQNPSIILADEPTGNLDSKTTLEIMDIFNQLHRERKTILIVTHEMDIAKMCQKIIRLVDGRIVEIIKNK